jgi:acyl carrier protein
MAYTALESRVRHLVADTLGVGVEELRPEVSLTDDLAADSLDLAELFARLETELGVVLGDRLVESLRTYGDLVRATVTETPAPRTGLAAAGGPPLPIWARLVSSHGQLLRAEFLTPYVAETIADEALHAGRGARIEVTVADEASDAELAGVRAEFAWLASHGVAVSFGRAHRREIRHSSEAA